MRVYKIYFDNLKILKIHCNIIQFNSPEYHLFCFLNLYNYNLFVIFLTRWAQGYNGSPALFVNRDTICFVCGNNIKFVNTRDKRESVLSSPGEGIGCFAVNPLYSNVAFAELKVSPRLFVYVFPDFSRPRAILEGERNFFSLCWVVD